MGKKQIALWWVLVDFTAFSLYVVYTEGYFAFVGAALEFGSNSMWGAQILIDFLVALSVALGWVIADARKRGMVYWPYVLLTLTAGSIGPLAYLIHRERVTTSAALLSSERPELQHA